ncbi:hypothetical protein Snoj_33040 [Streptomyces nojiriensis]|uniref:Uncharacterized protein n=1 Tax=Streptomyces nojiriensis TaxID=66374 RepID=A0ABQ3SMM1_9ACTN|nr:hypothetical protein [Streptomyces nojiriensis]QTI42955.1 hypothetical protein JYK04_00716 [Streptomyces nojiriensis]GGS33002.1 hypothetical protein GCM10010205_73970 [Streptomyces nojiriensis]GHI69386.1 hypothetical protein Snoj_33040 [Streptomyces nojiriensis]
MRRVPLGGPRLHAFEHAGRSLPAPRTEGFDDHVKFFFAEEGREPTSLAERACRDVGRGHRLGVLAPTA